MGDVGAGVCNVPARLCEDALVIVAVQEGVLDVAFSAALSFSTAGDSVRLQACLLQNDKQSALGRCHATLGYVGLYGQHGRVRGTRQGVVGGHFARLCRKWASWTLWGCGRDIRWINLHDLLLGAIRTGGGTGPSAKQRSLVDRCRFWAWWGRQFDVRVVLGLEQSNTIQSGAGGGARVTTGTGCEGRGHDRVLQGRKTRKIQRVTSEMEEMKKSDESDVFSSKSQSSISHNQVQISYSPTHMGKNSLRPIAIIKELVLGMGT